MVVQQVDSQHRTLLSRDEATGRRFLCQLLAHLLLSFTCYMFDYILYWILDMIQHHGNPRGVDTTGQAALEDVVQGHGAIVELLDLFLDRLHGGETYGFTRGENKCLPRAHAPTLHYLIVIFCMYILLIFIILLKAYMLRLRNCVTAYFYPERDRQRIVHLYNVILNRRLRMPKTLQLRARTRHREQQQQQEMSPCHKMAAKCAPCRVFFYAAPRCLVCNAVEDHTFNYCDTDRCNGVFCAECYNDLGYVCPLCLQGTEYEDENGVLNEDTLDDDFQPNHKTTKIYL